MLYIVVPGVCVVVDGIAWSAFDLLRARLGNIVANERDRAGQEHRNLAERMSNLASDQTKNIGVYGISVITVHTLISITWGVSVAIKTPGSLDLPEFEALNLGCRSIVAY